MVEGGGATGQMSLSLELPVMIDATTRAQFVQASTEAKVSAVYAQLEGTSGANIKYAIKGNASNAAVKALWNDAVAGALIASQIDLTATQIHINAQNVQIDGETIINNAKKIKAALIDVDNIFTRNLTLNGNSAALQSSNFSIGNSGFRLFANGKSLINECLFAFDLEMPVQTNWITNINDVSINMNTETAQAIKDKLDAIIDAHKSPSFSDLSSDAYVYANIVSADVSNLYVNYEPYSGFKEMLCHYLCRYTMNGIDQRYVISSKEQAGIVNIEREILRVNLSTGEVTKNISSYSSNKILIKTVSTEAEFFAKVYAREHIQGRLGHYVKRRGKVSSVNTALSTKGDVFDLLDKLLNGNEKDGVTLWYSDASDGLTARYPAMCSYTDSNKNKIRLFWHGGYADFPQNDTSSTDKRFIWI